MPGLFKRWLIARDVDRGCAASGDSDHDQYARKLSTLDRRLRLEAPLNTEDPPASLRTRTIHRLHHARSPHRRRGGYRGTPRLALAFVWMGLVAAAAIIVANAGDFLPSTTGGLSAETADDSPVNGAGLYAEVDALEMGHELDAVANDARRAADFVFSQLIPKTPTPPPADDQ